MRRFAISFSVLALVSTIPLANAPSEKCPILEVHRETTFDESCTAGTTIHYEKLHMFHGTLKLAADGDASATQEASFSRECLSEDGAILQSRALDISLTNSGRFELMLGINGVGEQYCLEGERVVVGYSERIQIRVQHEGCDDLLVPITQAKKPVSLELRCGQ